MPEKLLDMTVGELMSEIGKGKGMTGSGAVSVLSAISASELLVSICKLTLEKNKYSDVHKDMREMLDRLENSRLPLLREILDGDVRIVSEMVLARIKRNKEKDEDLKSKYTQEAWSMLEEATDSVLDLCDAAIEVIPMGLYISKVGVKSARADATVAVNTLISTVSSGLFMALSNLKASNNTEWVDGKHSELEVYFGRLHEYQSILNNRLANLYNNTWD